MLQTIKSYIELKTTHTTAYHILPLRGRWRPRHEQINKLHIEITYKWLDSGNNHTKSEYDNTLGIYGKNDNHAKGLAPNQGNKMS